MGERNARSRKVAPAHIQRVKRKYELYGCATQKEFADVIGISISTLGNFLAGEPVNKANFDEICVQLGLDWQEISEPIANTPSRAESTFITGNPITQPCKFFGRERELKRIFQLLNRHSLQNVAIIGDKRIGKTSLIHYIQTITRTPATSLRAKRNRRH